jgi:signal transduction histidine kinase
MITIEQAMRLLARLKEAAPPATAARLTDVMSLVETMTTTSTTNGSEPQLHTEPLAGFPSPQNVLKHSTDHLSTMIDLIEGQASSLRAGRLGRVTTEQADALKLVIEYAGSSLALIDLTRQMTRLRSGDYPLDILVFNPLDVAAEAWQRTFPQADARDHQFTIMADNPLPFVRGDYQQVLAILDAMVDNAVRYMPYGGDIKLTVNTLGTHLLFNVADSGIGLTGEDHQHVGEPFWRGLHHPLVRQHPGSGLHIYLARQVLSLMDGELFFSGEPGIGSTFSFTLPADQD